jgi:hypothetical protein
MVAFLTATLAVCVLVGVVVLAELSLADYLSTSPNASTQVRVISVLAHGDHLHYAVHLVSGRFLELCSCTDRAAATQYWRASFHARSGRQQQLLTDQRPANPFARAADTADLALNSLGWSVSEIPRLVTTLGPDHD